MSVLSDDTDVLLLIPPDFFAIDSDSNEDLVNINKHSERLLVSDLISQVNDLEGRICMIENQSVCNRCSMPEKENLKQLKQYGSADTLNTSCKSNFYSRSLQATPMKSQTLLSPTKSWKGGSCCSPKIFRKNLEQHQNILKSNEYITQKEKDDHLLKEINNFFNQKDCKNIEENTVGENNFEKEKSSLGKDDNEDIHLTRAVFNLSKVNDLLKQLEETQSEIEQKLKLKGLNGQEDEGLTCFSSETKFLSAKKKGSDVSTQNSSENKTPRRFLNFDCMSPDKKMNRFETNSENLTDISQPLNIEIDSSITPLKMEKEILDSKQESNIESKFCSEIDFLSLKKLWRNKKNETTTFQEDLNFFKQKVEEEKCRRIHCEELIQKLQHCLLEEQQKIAVALKVDQEKDEAISKLTDGWSKLVNLWKEVESQKSALEKKVQLEREKFEKEIQAAHQTVKRYETELSKALDLAHGYKEKCETSEKEKNNFLVSGAKEVENLKNELTNVKEQLLCEQNQIQKMEKLISAKEESLNQTKSKFFELQIQAKESKKTVKEQQTELELLKLEKEKLMEKIKEEKHKVSMVEQSKKALLQSNEELKKKEKSLKENIKSMGEQMEKIKIELKQFYQEQVEKIVQEKLKEFQGQLATAEKALQKEIEERERKVTEMAVKQVQQIVEKHIVEVNILEEKHKEEIELWKIKLVRNEEKVADLQKKLDYYSSHKTEIAQKLQNVMETQWQEALKIITASSPQQLKTPSNSGRSSADKPLARQNTFTMTSYGLGEGYQNKGSLPMDLENFALSPTSDLQPFFKEGQLTSRAEPETNSKMSYRVDETPQKIEPDTNDVLKKYIQMLLEHPPGLSMDDTADKSLDSSLLTNKTEGNFIQWQKILTEQSARGINHLSKQEGNKKSLPEFKDKIS